MKPALPITLACLLSLLPLSAAVAEGGGRGFNDGISADSGREDAPPRKPRPEEPTASSGRTEGLTGPGAGRDGVAPDDAGAIVNPCHASPQPTWCDQ